MPYFGLTKTNNTVQDQEMFRQFIASRFGKICAVTIKDRSRKTPIKPINIEVCDNNMQDPDWPNATYIYFRIPVTDIIEVNDDLC